VKALLVILGILGAIALSGALQDHTAAALHHGLIAEASAGLLVHHERVRRADNHQAATVALPARAPHGHVRIHVFRWWAAWRIARWVWHPHLLPWWLRG
jgi:hypothetical protein